MNTKKLDLFENKQKTMTIKEVAEVLNVNEITIRRSLFSIDPNIIQNGKKTLIDETLVTAIKLRLDKNHPDKNVEVKTALEKKLLIKQGYDFLMEEITNLQDENKQLKVERYDNKPKVEFYDRVTDTTDTIDITAVAQLLNIKDLGRNKLYELLRDLKILKDSPKSLRNTPYQQYIIRGYFKTIETETSGGIKIKTLVYQKGLDFIRKKVAF